MTPPVNQKTFNLVNRISKSFDLIIDNFAYAATLLFRIAFKITLTFSPKFLIGFVSIINLRRIKLIISQMKLRVSITQTINARRVRILYIMKERASLSLINYIRLRITATTKAIQKAITNIIIKKVTITAVPILAQFFTLGYYDPQTLGTLDVLTLGQMDYTT
jgi:hypothetical protein